MCELRLGLAGEERERPLRHPRHILRDRLPEIGRQAKIGRCRHADLVLPEIFPADLVSEQRLDLLRGHRRPESRLFLRERLIGDGAHVGIAQFERLLPGIISELE